MWTVASLTVAFQSIFSAQLMGETAGGWILELKFSIWKLEFWLPGSVPPALSPELHPLQDRKAKLVNEKTASMRHAWRSSSWMKRTYSKQRPARAVSGNGAKLPNIQLSHQLPTATNLGKRKLQKQAISGQQKRCCLGFRPSRLRMHSDTPFSRISRKKIISDLSQSTVILKEIT